MRIDIITLFPEMFPMVLENSIVGRARKRGHLQVVCHQLRDFSPDRRGRVDDTVFGGGKGMLLCAEPFARGLDAIKEHLGAMPHIIYMSPRGRVLSQRKARELAEMPGLILLCGHYEGVDQRLLDACTPTSSVAASPSSLIITSTSLCAFSTISSILAG